MDLVSGRTLTLELPRSVALGMLLKLSFFTYKLGTVIVYLIGLFSGINEFITMKCSTLCLSVLRVQLT